MVDGPSSVPPFYCPLHRCFHRSLWRHVGSRLRSCHAALEASYGKNQEENVNTFKARCRHDHTEDHWVRFLLFRKGITQKNVRHTDSTAAANGIVVSNGTAVSVGTAASKGTLESNGTAESNGSATPNGIVVSSRTAADDAVANGRASTRVSSCSSLQELDTSKVRIAPTVRKGGGGSISQGGGRNLVS